MKTSLSLLIATSLIVTGCERASSTATSNPTDQAPSIIAQAPLVEPEPIALTKTFETAGLSRAIDHYIQEPTPLSDASVEKAFASMGVEVAKLEERSAKTTGSDRDEAILKAKNLTDFRNAEALRFAKAKATHTAMDQPPVDARSGAQKIEDGARNAADTVKEAAKESGDAIKHAAKKTGAAIEEVVH